MPELPEVETVRRELEPWLTGRTIRRARRADAPPGPKYANLERAEGQRILGVGRRGKFLLLPLSGGDELVVHLGMTGIISPRDPQQHLRVVVDLSGRVFIDRNRRHRINLRLENLFDQEYSTSHRRGFQDLSTAPFLVHYLGVPRTFHLSYSFSY